MSNITTSVRPKIDLPQPNINEYGSVTSVASGSSTDVVTYTVPVSKKFYVDVVEYSGTNIAKFDVQINSSVVATKYTNHGDSPSGEFWFNRYMLDAGDEIKLTIVHMRPYTGDFSGRILGVEI